MRRESFWRNAFAAAGIFLAASGLRAQPAPEPATEIVPKQLVTARRFMVVAAHPLAARAGYDAIHRGGSAVDAAIAPAKPTVAHGAGCKAPYADSTVATAPLASTCAALRPAACSG